MKIKIKSIAVISGLILLTGCVAYTPAYPQYGYSAPPPVVAPYGGYGGYGGYGYGVAPLLPVPYFGFGGGWGRGGWGHGGYGGFRHH